jgi:hypothetical protein
MGSDFAYYFGDWIWPEQSSDLMKSMLLFFDGITLAVPSDVAAEMIDRDPVLAAPLYHRGLLRNFDPADTLNAEHAGRLAASLTELIRRHPLLWQGGDRRSAAPLGDIGTGHYGRLSLDRLSEHMADQGPHRAVVELEQAMRERNLLMGAPDACVVQMDPVARLLVLTGFAQTLRVQLQEQQINLHPITESGEVADWLLGQFHGYAPAVDHPTVASIAAQQFRADLTAVGADLSAVPLDEILDYRKENGRHYRAYAKGLREFLTSQTDLPAAEQQRALDDRKQEILDQAADLRRLSRQAFGLRSAALLLSLAGAAWTIHNGDPIGALFAASTALAQAAPIPTADTAAAYSYLIQTRELSS